MKTKLHTHTGALLALGSALLFSLGGIIIKVMPWHALSINAARNLIALCITFVFIRAIRHKLVLNRSVLCGAVAFAATSTLFCLATKMTTAANAILLQYTSPLFILLFTVLFFRQKPKRADLLMCGAVILGVGCFFFDSLAGGHLAGDCVALASGVMYAVVFMSNILPGGDAMSSFFFGEVLSVLIGAPFLLRETQFTPLALGGAAALGGIIGVGYILLSVALRTTKPITANLIGAVEPVLNPVWVMIFYGETLTPLALLGFAVVLISVVAYNILGARKREHP